MPTCFARFLFKSGASPCDALTDSFRTTHVIRTASFRQQLKETLRRDLPRGTFWWLTEVCMLLLQDTDLARIGRKKKSVCVKGSDGSIKECLQHFVPKTFSDGTGTFAKSFSCHVKRCVLKTHVPGSQSSLNTETSPALAAKLMTTQMFNSFLRNCRTAVLLSSPSRQVWRSNKSSLLAGGSKQRGRYDVSWTTMYFLLFSRRLGTWLLFLLWGWLHLERKINM